MAIFTGKKDSGDNPKAVWEQFFKATMKNDWPKALGFLDKLKTLEPDNSQVYMKAGDILQRTGDKAGAIKSYHKAIDCLEENIDSQKVLAICKIIMRLDPNDQKSKEKTQALMPSFAASAATNAAQSAAQAAAMPQVDMPSLPEPEPAPQAVEPEPPAQPEPQAPPAAAAPAAPQPVQAAAPKPQAPAQQPAAAQPAQTQAAQQQAVKDAIAKHPVLSVLTFDEVMSLPQRGKNHSFKDKEFVIKEDEFGDSMFIIKRGRAKVTTTIMGKTIELATLSTLDMFGEGGMLTGSPRSATVIAEGPLELLEIDKNLFEELTMSNPLIIEKLVETSQKRTYQTIKTIKSGGA